jgi:hypothetical protein
MSRPRIRSLKPEAWQDERVGTVSRDARLLWVTIITLADDAGRFRALPAVLCGHGFPYDQDALRKVGTWLDELESAGLVRRYEHGGVAYGWLPKWEDHQRIQRPSPSVIPAPSLNGSGSHP